MYYTLCPHSIPKPSKLLECFRGRIEVCLLTGNVTDGMALTTKACHQHFIVLLDVVEAAVPWHEGRDLLAVLDQLDTHTLTDGRVGLLGLNTTGKKDNTI